MMEIMSSAVVAMLAGTHRRVRSIDPCGFLFHRGDRVTDCFVVISGRVELVRQHANGSMIVVQRAGPGAILAEASIYSASYHCDAIAATAATVAVYPSRAVRDRLRSDAAFGEAWAIHLADEVRNARARGELLSLRTVRARLEAWMSLHDSGLPAKGEWKSVAQQIGVSPEALYREIARRRSNREGSP
jgi:CRP-like cAMP-binding protein